MNTVTTRKPRIVLTDGQVTTTSLAIAEHFGKNHKDVLRAIQNVIGDAPEEFTERNFALSDYTDPTGRSLPMYRLTRDGFVLVAMGFTGTEAMKWKIAYIDTFNRMERMLAERHEAAIDAEAEAYREDVLAAARQAVVEIHAQAITEAAQLTAVQLAGRLRIPYRPSSVGGYLSEVFMLIYFAVERRFTDAALLWTLYDEFGAERETVRLSAREIVQASRNALSRMSVYQSRHRLIERGLLVNLGDAQSWRIDRAQFDRMMRETQLVAHALRVPTFGDEHDLNAKLAQWLEALPVPETMQ